MLPFERNFYQRLQRLRQTVYLKRVFALFSKPHIKPLALVALVLFCGAIPAHAQSGRYLVQFKDKAQNPFSLSQPEKFLSARSLQRHAQHQIALDSTDLPVTPAYIDSLRGLASVTVLNVSKWLNQVSIQVTNPAVLDTINRFPFVQHTAFVASKIKQSSRAPKDQISFSKAHSGMQGLTTVQALDYGATAGQMALHNAAFLHNLGLQGQGLIIGMLDAGFYHYTSLKAFDSVNQSNRVLGTWDFVARDTGVAEDHPHGMYCFSTIAANIPGVFVGTAPGASFYLFRSEDAATEYPIEEHNWVCAAERVDSAGGDVISSSLGYSVFNDPALNHQYSDLDGDHTMVAIGADLAAQKGILVVVAAGNEGNNSWKYLVTPADADSVLAVGAVNAQGQVGAFSSYGPSAAGRIKPDVVSVGVSAAIQGTNNALATGNGTSFACPNMAGLATCLWQGFPEATNMQIIQALRASGSLFQTPNDRIGYGIPDLKKAAQLLLQQFVTVHTENCNTISWTSKDVAAMRYEIERKKRNETSFTSIATQSGTGALFQSHTYQFTDPEITGADGTVQYRIRQVIDTATNSFTAFYLDTVSVSMGLLCTPVPTAEHGVQIVPNPVRQSLHVKIESAATTDLQLVIVNAIGQRVYAAKNTKGSGLAAFAIGTSGLAPGVYYLQVYADGKKLATKPFVKL